MALRCVFRSVCPDMFVDAKCSVCERELATLRHIMWGGCNSAMDSGNGQCQDATYPEEVAGDALGPKGTQLSAPLSWTNPDNCVVDPS
ncbi:hypothetical protein HPB50_028756 [Hyalomma asiaticum]|nr:hypothetical protein HPB50_028756 [Hyalomma asiaticum]